MFHDLRYSLRQLRNSPGFTITVVMTLALAIGANTAVFSVFESVLLRPLPFQNSDRLFAIWATQKDQPGRFGASMPEFEDYKDGSRSFEYMANYLSGWTITWTGQGEARTVNCTGISSDFFPMLGVKPYLGRLYTPEEYHVDGVQVVISYRFWKEQLGSDPRVIGRILNLDGTAQTVVGVMPPVSDLFPETDVWAKDDPDFDWMRMRGNKFLDLVGRLKPGVTREQAEHEMTAILQRGPGESPKVAVHLVPLKDELTGSVRSQLQMVLAAAALVLLIACANIAYLWLDRNMRRQVEIAIRVSLGAGKGRIVRQFVTQNLILATLGGAVGMMLAVGGVRLFGRTGILPRSEAVGVDVYALLFALVITVLTGLFVACAPSSVFSRLDFASMLKKGRGEVGKVGRSRSRSLLASQVAVAVMLCVAAGLLLRSLWEAEHLDPGFSPNHLLAAYLRTNDWREGRRFFPELVERATVLPGVRVVALGKCMPGISAASASLVLSDRPSDPSKAPTVEGCWISSDFFRAIGTPLVSGRFFNVHDDASAPAVAIVNRALAEEYWPGQNPIGKQLGVNYLGSGRSTEGVPRSREVVGVVTNVKQQGLDLPTKPALYTPYLQDETNHAFAGFNLFVRTAGAPASSAATIRALIRSMRSDQPIDEIVSVNDSLSRTLAPRRVSLILVASFAGLALLSATLGIFAMTACTVSQRIPELALRIALGARRPEVMQLVLGEGLKIVVMGVLVGIGTSLLLAPLMRGLLYAVAPNDPLTFAAVAVLLALVVLPACYIPAHRATCVDPIVALRNE